MTARRPRVLFYVQHLLGIGHLKRAATLARAAAGAGLDVTLVSGGQEVPGLALGAAKLIQLAPVRAADKYFKVLVDADGHEIDDAFRGARRDRLLRVFADVAPDIVITELFPFGRRQLRFELLAMLDEARAAPRRPTIVCSVRDILVEPPKPERVAEMLDLVERYYDLVLVHGDPTLIPFDETFAPAHRIADKLRYTGYVVDEAAGRRGDGQGAGEVIVSAGGGAVSEELFRAAIAARPRTRLAGAPWRLLAGHALAEPEFAALATVAPDGVVVERARPDFSTLLSNAALSISQGGYNTVMEVLAAGARGVIVPYAGGLETEQTLRARLLERQSGLRVVEEGALSAETLVDAVEAALAGPPPSADGLDTNGAGVTSGILRGLAEARMEA
jgi:predicted glycosyltransferase